SIEEGVIFTPGSILGTKSDFMRLTYGKASDEEIPIGIKRLAKALGKITS
ncbi:PLP-dependent aminotransferase family protein, partial [Niallia circulans]